MRKLIWRESVNCARSYFKWQNWDLIPPPPGIAGQGLRCIHYPTWLMLGPGLRPLVPFYQIYQMKGNEIGEVYFKRTKSSHFCMFWWKLPTKRWSLESVRFCISMSMKVRKTPLAFLFPENHFNSRQKLLRVNKLFLIIFIKINLNLIS